MISSSADPPIDGIRSDAVPLRVVLALLQRRHAQSSKGRPPRADLGAGPRQLPRPLGRRLAGQWPRLQWPVAH